MPALLYCRTGPMAGASFSLDAEATVGRTGEHAVTLSDDRISSRHARIWPDPDSGVWMIEDLESSNGTLVDGSSVAEPVELDDLNVITFAGRFDFIFQLVASAAVSAPAARAVDRPAAAGSAPKSDPADNVATQAGGAPPSLPDTSLNTADEAGVRTTIGGAAPSLPDVGASTDDSADDVRTRLGGKPPSLPDVGGDADGIHTRVGGSAPDLPKTGDSGSDSGGDNESVRTRLGGTPPDLPDSGGSKHDDSTRTRAGGAPPSLPDLSEQAETVGPGKNADSAGGRSATKGPTSSVILRLHSTEESDADSEFTLGPGEHVVGRSSECEVQIEDASLSRRHAVITVGDGRITIRDEGSKNGTYVDGEKVTGERTISAENRLRFGFRMEAWISDDQGT